MRRKDEIEAIRSASPIEVVIGERIELKKDGVRYRAVCPFHDDVNPSLVVSPDKGLWNCLGCPKGNGKTGGDVFDFVVRFERVAFSEAVEILRRRAGLPGPAANGNGHAPTANGNGTKRAAASPQPKRVVSLDRRKKLLGRIADVYHREYLGSEHARNYVESERRILGGLAAKHRIGYTAGDVIARLVPEGGEVLEELQALGVVNPRGGERFKGRVVFPLLDSDGEVVGLLGRSAHGIEPRHMALPEPFLGLFNRAALVAHDWVVLVEGVFDALAVESAGYANVIPLCGKSPRPELLSALRVAGVREVVVLLDAGEDLAGQAVAEKLRTELPAALVRVANLAEGDPNTTEHEILRRVIDEARGLGKKPEPATAPPAAPAAPEAQLAAAPLEDGALEIVFETRRYIVRAIEKRGEMRLRVNLRAESGAHFHLDTINLFASRDRKSYARDAAMLFRVEYAVTERDLGRILERVEAYIRSREEQGQAEKKVALSEGSRAGALALGRSAELLDQVVRDARKLGVVGEEANILAMYLLVTSRKMADPLSILFLSGSGSGKSLVQDKVLSLCPDEDLILVTALTGRSLFYREKSLRGKVLAIREETGAESAGYAIRALISDKELVVEATIKDPVTGRLTTMTNRVEGPPAVSVTSASPTTDAETVTRFLVLSIDESMEQTEKILEHQREGETVEGLLARREREAIVERHRALQRILEPVEVVNPFSKLLTYPVRSLRARRSQPMYLALIRTVAFLNQMKKARKVVEHGGETISYIEVDLDDIRAAHSLAHLLLGGTIEDLSEVGRKLLDEIDGMVGKREAEEGLPREEILFSRRDVREATGRGDFQVRTYLAELVGLEYVVPVHVGQGRRTLYRLDYRGEGQRRGRFALGLVELQELERRAREQGLV